MAAALYDPREGYYRRADRALWGRTGDYRTSPERSPLFAATFARYFASLYEELDRPQQWTITEAGAGAGDFARGVLEVFARDYPRVLAATRYVIDEIGEGARAAAREKLSRFADRIEFRHPEDDAGARVASEAGEGIVFSNELIDAFPVHRVRMRGGRLRELCVDANDSGEFVFVERDPSTPRLARHFARLGVALREGQAAEVNLGAEGWIKRAAAKVVRGYVVTVDYGAEAAELYDAARRPEGTLRAFRAHRFCKDPLAYPGEQDLTTTIDWTQLRRAGEEAGLQTVLFERQDTFLLGAGIVEQLEGMTARADEEAERVRLHVAAREMILPGGMGESFQVLVQKK